MQEAKPSQVRSLAGEDPLEEGMTTHPSVPAQRIPWTARSSPQGHDGSDKTTGT